MGVIFFQVNRYEWVCVCKSLFTITFVASVVDILGIRTPDHKSQMQSTSNPRYVTIPVLTEGLQG